MAKEGSNLGEDLTSMLDFDVNAILSGGDPSSGDPVSIPNESDPIQDIVDDGSQNVTPTKNDNEFDINKILDSSLQTDDDSNKDNKKSTAKTDKTGEAHAPQKTDSTPSSLITFSLAKDLLERGLISELGDEEEYKKLVEETGDEYEALAKVIEDSLYKEKESIVGELEQDIQTYIQLRDLGVASDTVNRLASTQFKLEKLTDDDIEGEGNVEMRKLLLTQYYKKTTSMDDDEIKELVEGKVDTGKDVEGAKQAKAKLLKLNQDEVTAERTKAEQSKVAAEQNYKQQQVKFKQMVENIQEIFPDAKLNKNQKADLENMVMKAVAQDPNGKPVNAVWNEYFKDNLKFQLAVAYHIKNGTLYGKAITNPKLAEKKAMQNLKEKLDSGRNNLGVNLDIAQVQASRGLDGLNDRTADNLKEMKELFGR